jgi:hypothetical protein
MEHIGGLNELKKCLDSGEVDILIKRHDIITYEEF